MAATGINHVTIYTDALEELVSFYTDVFGLDRVQSPNLGAPAAWLRCGDKQLHIVERDTQSPEYHHFALTVDNFETVFDLARERDILADSMAPDGRYPLYKLPDNVVQLYIRDPADNLVEIDWPDVNTLSERIQEHVIDRCETHEQSPSQAEATLFL